MEREKVVALCSGGFDSIVMLNDLARNPLYDIHVLFFDYGQRNCMHEKKWVEYWVDKLDLNLSQCIGITLPPMTWCESSTVSHTEVKDYENLEAQYVPMRNMIFASYALSYAESVGAKQIFMALLGGGTYPDTTTDFVYYLNEIAEAVGIEFVAPFISHDKMFLYSRAMQYGMYDEKPLFFSCNTPVNGEPCGKCADCKVIEEMFWETP